MGCIREEFIGQLGVKVAHTGQYTRLHVDVFD